VTKADKGHRSFNLLGLEGWRRRGSGRTYINIRAKVIESVLCSGKNKGFEAVMETTATRRPLAKDKGAVKGKDRVEAAAEQLFICKPIADGCRKHAKRVADMDNPGPVAVKWDRWVERSSRKERRDRWEWTHSSRASARRSRNLSSRCSHLWAGHTGALVGRQLPEWLVTSVAEAGS
jgi:hypothetical protein